MILSQSVNGSVAGLIVRVYRWRVGLRECGEETAKVESWCASAPDSSGGSIWTPNGPRFCESERPRQDAVSLYKVVKLEINMNREGNLPPPPLDRLRARMLPLVALGGGEGVPRI